MSENHHYLVSVLIVIVSLGNPVFALQNESIIPAPQKIIINQGDFSLNGDTKIAYSQSSIKELAVEFQNTLKTDFGIDAKLYKCGINQKPKSTIELKLQKGFENEAYQINIQSNIIICKASTEAGLFYAIQSIRQLVRTENCRLTIPCMQIDDAPRFAWRGFMLDEARHFFGKKTVMQYLNIMSMLKMNRFHWHLSDEQAFRLELKQFPQLSTVGSIGSWSNSKAPAAYYTQKDIKEIVDYATRRHIVIIPEIDMPGHATAITRSYPYLSGGGEGRWAGFTFNPAKESTYQFIDSLFTDIATLFPSPYIHVGADEVHFGNQSWFTDPEIQNFIKENKLTNELDLEHYFIKRVNQIILNKGKQMLGWDEIVNIGLKKNDATIMWWRHNKPEVLSQSLTKGFNVILTPRLPCYFDFVQDESHQIGRRSFDKVPSYNTLNLVYEFPDSSIEITNIIKGYEKQTLGIQASLWTERIQDKKRLDFLTFPRLIAMAEAGWTKKENKSYQNFLVRLKLFIKEFKNNGIYYFDIFDKSLTPEPWGPSKEDVIGEG